MSTGSSGSIPMPRLAPLVGGAWHDPVERRPAANAPPPRPVPAPRPIPIPIPAAPRSPTDVVPDRPPTTDEPLTVGRLLAESLGRRELMVALISSAVHMVLVIVLALLVIAPPSRPTIMLTASPPEEDVPPDLIESPKVELPTIAQGPLIAAPMAVQAPQMAPVNFGFNPDAPKTLAALDSRMLNDAANLGGAGGDDTVSFFNQTSIAKRVVFIVDASTSMSGSKFERAKEELLAAVSNLKPDQRFFIYFFSDKDYPMLAPRTPTDMIALTTLTWEQVLQWVNEQGLVGQTKPLSAVKRAFNLRPDVIYLLTDGDFNDDTLDYLMRLSNYRVRVNTIGFQVGSKAEDALKKIARKFRGEYVEVND